MAQSSEIFLAKLEAGLRSIASKIKAWYTAFSNREALIHNNYKRYKSSYSTLSDEVKDDYQKAVLSHRLMGFLFKVFMKLYTRYLYPNDTQQSSAKGLQPHLQPEQIKGLLIRPERYIVSTIKGFEMEVAKRVSKEAEKIRNEYIKQLLPFTEGEQTLELGQDYFAQKDASRISYYAQQKRLEKLEERERKTTLKEEKLDIAEERLGLQKLQMENERKLFEISVHQQEVEHKIKMLELTNLSLEIQKRTNNVEQMKREMHITQALHDLEVRKQEQTIQYGEELLRLKEQGLENQLALKEAEYLRIQTDNQRTQIAIENRILDLRDGEFKQQAQQHLFDIREKEVGLEIKRLNMYKQESRMEQRNYELTNQLHREQIALETQKQHLHDQQQILNLNL